jgi:hypothetical protein
VSYHKDRRYHKQQMRRVYERVLRAREFIRRAMLYSTVRTGIAQIAAIRSTPADRFEAGKAGKELAIAQAVVNTYASLNRVADAMNPRPADSNVGSDGH